MKYLLAIDQGTTNSRVILFNQAGELAASHEIALTQYFPQDGWVEQNALEMVENTKLCCQQAVKKANISPRMIAAIGITNQRETTIIWDKKTGKPIYPAIVWQDRRTSQLCNTLSHTHFYQTLIDKTGLLLDPYFSATKIKWILDHVDGARDRAERHELLFGTVDCFLLWHLTKDHQHITDVTNASRTLLFNIHQQQWDDELLNFFQIPKTLLPAVYDNTSDFGQLDASILGIAIPICAMAGDQQAATVGQACFEPGLVKATYGTGCFMVLNTGSKLIYSKNRLLSTIAYRINNETTYALEGSIFSAGVIVKWLRDTLHIIQSAQETEMLANSVPHTEGIYFVPAFTGLGAPYWQAEARGMVTGLTRQATREHIVRAALESIAYQTRDLLEALKNDFQSDIKHLRVDGGMAANDWLMQFIADMLNLPLYRPLCIETTALGVAFLAGLQIGMYLSLTDIQHLCAKNKLFSPNLEENRRETLYIGWKNAVQRVLN